MWNLGGNYIRLSFRMRLELCLREEDRPFNRLLGGGWGVGGPEISPWAVREGDYVDI